MQMLCYYGKASTEFAELLVAVSDEGVCWVSLANEDDDDFWRFLKTNFDNWIEDKDKINNIAQKLVEYFSGQATDFSVNLNLIGTEFQKQVWQQLLTIPYGKTKTYGQIAKEIGRPKAVRAVGGACNKNPIAFIVPCHRVIGSNGKLVGYAGGLNLKARLLQIENSLVKGK